MKKIVSLLLVLFLTAMVPGSALAAPSENREADSPEYEDIFSEWNEDAPALQTLIEYVEDVTDKSSDSFIPVADRIAVFDLDGTLYGELFPTCLEYYALAWRILADPSYEPDAELVETAEEIRDHAMDQDFSDDMPIRHALAAARAYSGMTIPEFTDYVTAILKQDADGFEGMTYGEAFYLPMLEVIEYLQDNDFTVYVVSDSDRMLCRILLEGSIDIPYANIIGMDVALEASGQNGTDGLEYEFDDKDEIVRTDQLQIKNLKMNKVSQIAREIGRQPVLSFGNSTGDVSMHNYTIDNNKYKSAAFMLIADDEERDYGNTKKSRELGKEWEEDGYHVISMKDDFKTIYGKKIKKTDEFQWDKILSGRTEETAEEKEEEDIQYVLYLGTNDKDTNKPVFSPAEAKKKLKEILIKNFGGYTIQEAEGGWVDDDGTEFEEYTLVIYLSDTTREKVHEVSDKLISLFHQSSILIQANTTQTEFYEGK